MALCVARREQTPSIQKRGGAVAQQPEARPGRVAGFFIAGLAPCCSGGATMPTLNARMKAAESGHCSATRHPYVGCSVLLSCTKIARNRRRLVSHWSRSRLSHLNIPRLGISVCSSRTKTFTQSQGHAHLPLRRPLEGGLGLLVRARSVC